ncbi:hypothetical protein BCIN_03g03470 [Botrytis cinerea B05.10]|uniref:Uncharacterized protein n=3 Tax=Botryotinia fuckeliana TaxID=40559 RepID=A0A384JBW8_BOTFB|nr:hypothetical protein BCIN_03g03470 [Botrytis cinerea B05.10]ATZ48099.1 hypothetical protein BCIN_03g03470 [Botrytis cinerea B05.10]EMR84989.1 putative carbohydrate-binding module family 1 protein [Botrytis cinerea BcDW1]CCD51842.1 hypothetical protein BofuT4P10000104001 [Botrytis cinerea T4]
MYFNFHSVACAITALLTFQAAAVPISVNPLAQGASVESPAGDVRTYYQAGDGSIIEVTPNFPASSGYVSKVLIPAGVARLNTPLAAISWGAFDEIHLYYIGVGFTNTQLREKIYKSGVGWADGGLNALGYTVQTTTSFLTAYHDGTTVAASTWRVAFVCSTLGLPVAGSLCEASKTSSTPWAVAAYA